MPSVKKSLEERVKKLEEEIDIITEILIKIYLILTELA